MNGKKVGTADKASVPSVNKDVFDGPVGVAVQSEEKGGAQGIDIDLLAEAIASKLMRYSKLSVSQEGDYTVDDLMALMHISRSTANAIATGRYAVGGAVRFRREDIQQRRQLGKKIEVER